MGERERDVEAPFWDGEAGYGDEGMELGMELGMEGENGAEIGWETRVEEVDEVLKREEEEVEALLALMADEESESRQTWSDDQKRQWDSPAALPLSHLTNHEMRMSDSNYLRHEYEHDHEDNDAASSNFGSDDEVYDSIFADMEDLKGLDGGDGGDEMDLSG